MYERIIEEYWPDLADEMEGDIDDGPNLRRIPSQSETNRSSAFSLKYWPDVSYPFDREIVSIRFQRARFIPYHKKSNIAGTCKIVFKSKVKRRHGC